MKSVENRPARPTLSQRQETLLWIEQNHKLWEVLMRVRRVEAGGNSDYLVFVNDPESDRYGEVGQLRAWDEEISEGVDIEFPDGIVVKFRQIEGQEALRPETLVKIPKPGLGESGWAGLSRLQPGVEQFKEESQRK